MCFFFFQLHLVGCVEHSAVVRVCDGKCFDGKDSRTKFSAETRAVIRFDIKTVLLTRTLTGKEATYDGDNNARNIPRQNYRDRLIDAGIKEFVQTVQETGVQS